MSVRIYNEDSIKLDTHEITTEIHPVFGPMTIFHDMVMASEMVQEYGDGSALKDRDELKDSMWTGEGMWATPGGHPETPVVMDRNQIGGRVVNMQFKKDLMDPVTERPSRAGLVADLQVFNKKISPELLQDLKKGKKTDVSIGFFFDKDETPGEHGGVAFDYVQRNITLNHLAFGIDNGRCPSPLCGLTADEAMKQVAADPFAGFANFAACQAQIGEENPDLGEEGVNSICGALKAETEESDMNRSKKNQSVEAIKLLLDGLDDIDETSPPTPWYLNEAIDWNSDEYKTLYVGLSDAVKQELKEKGICPDCLKNQAMDLSLEEIEARLVTMKEDREKIRDERRAIEEEMWSETPEERAKKMELRENAAELWDQEMNLTEEINAFSEARVLKLVQEDVHETKVCPPGFVYSEERGECVKEWQVRKADPAKGDSTEDVLKKANTVLDRIL